MFGFSSFCLYVLRLAGFFYLQLATYIAHRSFNDPCTVHTAQIISPCAITMTLGNIVLLYRNVLTTWTMSPTCNSCHSWKQTSQSCKPLGEKTPVRVQLWLTSTCLVMMNVCLFVSWCLMGHCTVATWTVSLTELRSRVKVEVAVLGSNTEFELVSLTELMRESRGGRPGKQHWIWTCVAYRAHERKSRWPSWAPGPSKSVRSLWT